MSKVLLVTDVPPSKKFSGSLLTWHLCKNFSASTLLGYFIVNPELNVKAEFPFAPEAKYIHVDKPSEMTFRPPGLPKVAKVFISFARELYRKYVEVPRHGREVLKFAKENNADKIWIILQGQTMVWLCEYLIKKAKFPIHAQVWDSASWWARATWMDRFSKPMLMRSYRYCVQNCDEFGSPSFNMTKILKEQHGKESYPLLGISPTPAHVDLSESKLSDDKFIIGFAGQIYAGETFSALVAALDSVYWEIEGKKVEIHFWGAAPMPIHRSRIISRGYVTQEQLLQELAKCHLLYCPYWFNPLYDEESRTSFPSKVASYLNSGRPVFYHGAQGSSPSALLEEKRAGICCYSTEPEVILLYLRKALFSPEVAEILSNAAKLAKEELDESYARQSFRKFMKLQPVLGETGFASSSDQLH